jgi:hypothetical protein
LFRFLLFTPENHADFRFGKCSGGRTQFFVSSVPPFVSFVRQGSSRRSREKEKAPTRN